MCACVHVCVLWRADGTISHSFSHALRLRPDTYTDVTSGMQLQSRMHTFTHGNTKPLMKELRCYFLNCGLMRNLDFPLFSHSFFPFLLLPSSPFLSLIAPPFISASFLLFPSLLHCSLLTFSSQISACWSQRASGVKPMPLEKMQIIKKSAEVTPNGSSRREKKNRVCHSKVQ